MWTRREDGRDFRICPDFESWENSRKVENEMEEEEKRERAREGEERKKEGQILEFAFTLRLNKISNHSTNENSQSLLKYRHLISSEFSSSVEVKMHVFWYTGTGM